MAPCTRSSSAEYRYSTNASNSRTDLPGRSTCWCRGEAGSAGAVDGGRGGARRPGLRDVRRGCWEGRSRGRADRAPPRGSVRVRSGAPSPRGIPTVRRGRTLIGRRASAGRGRIGVRRATRRRRTRTSRRGAGCPREARAGTPSRARDLSRTGPTAAPPCVSWERSVISFLLRRHAPRRCDLKMLDGSSNSAVLSFPNNERLHARTSL